MARDGYFVEAGVVGLKPIDTLMIIFRSELLTSNLIDAMEVSLREQYLSSLAIGINSQIVYVSGKQRVYYPSSCSKKTP